MHWSVVKKTSSLAAETVTAGYSYCHWLLHWSVVKNIKPLRNRNRNRRVLCCHWLVHGSFVSKIRPPPLSPPAPPPPLTLSSLWINGSVDKAAPLALRWHFHTPLCYPYFDTEMLTCHHGTSVYGYYQFFSACLTLPRAAWVCLSDHILFCLNLNQCLTLMLRPRISVDKAS
jgi:hypothetical protein